MADSDIRAIDFPRELGSVVEGLKLARLRYNGAGDRVVGRPCNAPKGLWIGPASAGDLAVDTR